MSRIDDVMGKLARKFQPDAAEDLDAVFQIRFDDHPPYQLAIAGGACTVTPGEHPDPDITLLMDSDTFCDIIDGDLGGTQAFLSGRLRAEGNVLLGTRLGKLFRR